MAFVVVQHLERHHPSLLVELLGRRTSIPIRQAVDGEVLQADRVFVIPPNAQMTLSNGVLRVTAYGAESRMTIDTFFRSLSLDQGELAIGVVLSGTGTDGTLGLRSIKEQGGLTLAQVPATAKHAAMPESAIAAGFVDEVLAPSAMPARLLEHVARIKSVRGGGNQETEVRESLPRIAELIRHSTGHDFGRYKEGTLVRRIRRRILLLHMDTMAEYLRRLAEDPAEPQLLLKDLLIGVTQFFREPAAFEALAEKAIAKLLEEVSNDRPVRIWVPGCATGEEAYSIAILLNEQFSALGKAHPVQIFATDIDTEALAAARVGRYRAEIAEQVSTERLARCFTRVDDGYQVVKELRDTCVFSAHNLIRDPPFSNLDLISCRNLLIYFEPELQRKVVPLLHYALRRSGFLFLGSSEELSGHPELFAPIDRKQRLFQRRDPLVRPTLEFPLSGPRAARGLAAPTEEPSARNPTLAVLGSFERMLLDDFAPAAAVVDERGEMLCLGGRRGLLLQAPGGLVTNNILDHTEGTLRHALRTTLAEAVSKKAEVVGSEILTDFGGTSRRLRVTVRPAPGAPAQSGLHAVIVEDLGLVRASRAQGAAALAHEPMIENLESELKSTRADLQAANEELEGANEELKSSNEELTSTNEELRSTNEELQTSKEELLSVNEELETVNTELRQKVHELGVANSDLQNLFSSTQVATIFLDRKLNLTKFTPAATTLFRFADADIGRPLSDLAPRFAGADLPADVHEVLRTLVPLEREIRAGDAWFILRVLPYRTLEDAIAGAVITFTDVTKLKRAEVAMRLSEGLLKDVIDGTPSIVFLKDLQGRFLNANKSLEALLGLTREQLRGKTDYDIFPRDKAELYRKHDQKVAESKQPIAVEEVTELLDGHHVFLASKFPLFDSAGRIYGVGAISHDITERKSAEELIRRYASLLRLSHDAIFVRRIGGEVEFWNSGAEQLYGFTEQEALGQNIHELLQTSAADGLGEVQGALAREGHWEGELEHRAKDGRRVVVSAHMQVLRDEDGVDRVLQSNRDITQRKRAEGALKRSRQGLSHLAEASVRVMRETDLEPMFRSISAAALELTGARIAVTGHGYVSGHFVLGGAARAPGAPDCPPDRSFSIEKGGVYLHLLDGSSDCIRLNDEQMRADPRWWGLPEGHVPMRGLLGVRLVDRLGRTDGVVLVTDKDQGDFTEDDERFLRQLGTLASLALQHVEARVSLQEADRRKNEFLAVLSHELRNPLTPLRNSMYVLERTSALDPDQEKRARAVIGRQVTHLVQLVDDLLDVTRIARGKVQLRKEPLDLGELVSRTIEDHRPSFGEAGIELRHRIESGLWIEGDRTRIDQIVGNLLQNAVKFTPRGGVVSVSCEAGERARAVLRVRDTGAGISPELLPFLFEPFTQADRTLERTKGGLGLGLAIVKGLAEQHGGSVAAHSEGLGEGSEFEVALPRRPPPETSATLAAAPVGPDEAPALSVLIIEDNRDAADSLKEVLELGNRFATVAYSGVEGLDKARALRPDVVLCDLGLPEMNGYAVARAMRADSTLASATLVALTGYAASEDVARSQEAGFDHHLAKPPSIEDLERIFAQVVRRVSSGGSAS